MFVSVYLQVLKSGKGELVLARRPNTKVNKTAADFIPCEFCYQLYDQDCMYLHARNCIFAPEKRPTVNYRRNGKALLARFCAPKLGMDKLGIIYEHIKDTQKNPGIKAVCIDDSLIRFFAEFLFSQLGPKHEQRQKDCGNIRTKIRYVARLLILLNKDKPKPKDLDHYICADRFSEVVEGVKDLAVETDCPMIAQNIGHYLRYITLLKISSSIEKNDNKGKADGNEFKQLMDLHWNDKVTSIAKRRQSLRTLSKAELQPLPQDVWKLGKWAESKSKELMVKDEKLTDEEYKLLSQLLLTRLIIFNKVEHREVHNLTVSDLHFAKLQAKNQDNDERQSIPSTLTPLEKVLANRYVSLKGLF